MTIYLSGPMTGYPEFNKPAFDHYAAKYRALGFTVFSPPELDAEIGLGKPYEVYIKRDINVLCDCGVTRIYMMPGWEFSRGARVERHICEVLGIAVYDAETGRLLEPAFHVPQRA